MTIHRYWTGKSSPPFEPWLSKVIRNLNPDIELVEWRDDTLPHDILDMCDSAEGQVRKADRIRHRANIIRLGLLAHFGGWWYDYDVIPRQPVSDLPYPVSGAHGGLCNSFLGYPRAHPELLAAIASIARTKATFDAPSTLVSGEDFLEPRLTCARLQYRYDSSGQQINDGSEFAIHVYNNTRRSCR